MPRTTTKPIQANDLDATKPETARAHSAQTTAKPDATTKSATTKSAISKSATAKNASQKKRRVRIRPETREQMLERLLNPEVTLHEASLLIGVCRATLRRYASDGALPHERTSGNQRRFRLRDVLTFSRAREAEKAKRKRRYGHSKNETTKSEPSKSE